jgi:hypothetical protein
VGNACHGRPSFWLRLFPDSNSDLWGRFCGRATTQVNRFCLQRESRLNALETRP